MEKTCVFCKRLISGYDAAFNSLVIDEKNSFDICQGCVGKFVKWQQGIFTLIYPTNAAKKWIKGQ